MEGDIKPSEPGQNQPGANQISPKEPRKSWTSEYYDAVRAGFWRTWRNRFLWFWGFFLPVGLGTRFNYNIGPENDQDEQRVDGYVKDGLEEALIFLQNNIQWIILAVVVFFAIVILFWVISAIARVGVTKAINQMQSNDPITFNFKEIWRQGKSGFGQILLIDLIIGIVMFAIIAVISVPMFVLVARQQYIFVAILGVFAVIIIIPIAVLAYFLKTSGAIVSVLSGSNATKAIELAYGYFSKNFKEALKLLVTLFLLSLVQGFVMLIVILAIVIAMVLLGVLLGLIVGFEALLQGQAIVAIASLVGIFALLVAAAAILVKAISSVWLWDIWLWWTKKVGALYDQQQEKDSIKMEKNVEPVSPTVE